MADRLILLDHLTRGRVMLGVGPGALPTDAVMIGIDPADQRQLLEDSMDILMHLLRSDEPLTARVGVHTLVNAKTQLRPFSDDLHVAVAAIASPSGPRIAGKHGLGLLSIGATMAIGADLLALHWDVMEERAATFGSRVDRRDWRLVGPMHIAETKEQAMKEVEFGIDDWFDYLQKVAAAPQFCPLGDTLRERIDWVNDTGVGVIGTPDDAIAQIENLQKQSGGAGTYLMMAHDWANWENTKKHYELFARYVMPTFQGSTTSTTDSENRARASKPELNQKQADALTAWTDKHAKETSPR